MRDTAGKPPHRFQPRRFFQLRLAPPPCGDIQHPQKGTRLPTQGAAMHLHRRIGGLIRSGEPRFHGGRGRGAGQGYGDDLAHRILAGGCEKQRGVAPRSRCRAIGTKSFQHGTCRADAPFRIQNGKPGFFF